MTPRERLEAEVWRHWPTRGPEAETAVDAILAAADEYAATEVGLLTPAERRRVIEGETP